MEYVNIQLTGKSYDKTFASNVGMSVLGTFLTSDATRPSSIKFFREWIFDDRYKDTGGNLSFLEKENDAIIIGSSYADFPYGFIFECSKQQLAGILNRWKELIALQPQEIIIAKNGDTFTLEGRDFRDQKD